MMTHPPDDPHGGSSATLDSARAMTARGWVVFPCDHPTGYSMCQGLHRPGKVCEAKERGKHPMVKWGDYREPVADAQLVAWFGDERNPANVGVACGPSDLLVIDEDKPGTFLAYAASIGQEIPETFTVRTGRGTHWYFTAPEGRALGNVTGALPLGLDVRGGRGLGGYVIGPGSEHTTGTIYAAADWDLPAYPLPEWLIEALTVGGRGPAADGGGAGPRGKAGEPGTALPTSDVARWSDDVRYGWPDELRAEFVSRCAAVNAPGQPFRENLWEASAAGYRLLALAPYVEITEAEVTAELHAAVWRVWASPPDADDEKLIEEGWGAAQVSRWDLTADAYRVRALELAREDRLPERTPRGQHFTTPRRHDDEYARAVVDLERSQLPDTPSEPVTSGNGVGDTHDPRTMDGNRPVDDDRDTTQAVDIELSTLDDVEQKLRRAELALQARRRWAREQLDADLLPVLRPLSWAEFRATKQPEYLVPRMLYRNGLAVVFGAPGAGKSFIVLDIALAVATGREWFGDRLTGRDGGPGVVHYVMAEGLDINLLRADAWMHHHDAADDQVEGHFVVIEEGIALTDPGITQYLPIVTHGKPDVIVLDTKNALFTGKESAGDELGAMIRVLNRLRRAAGGCAVILIDHSGLVDTERARGSNAQQAGVHTEIKVSVDEETGVYTALVKRDKAAGLHPARWHWRLEPVPGVSTPKYMDPPAVCVPTDPEAHKPFTPDGNWYTDMRPLSDKLPKFTGHGKAMAIPVIRILRWVSARNGMSKTDIKDAILAAGLEYDRTQVGRALALLEEHGIVAHPGKQTAQWILVPPYDEVGSAGA